VHVAPHRTSQNVGPDAKLGKSLVLGVNQELGPCLSHL
jgi:hypothetical protein